MVRAAVVGGINVDVLAVVDHQPDDDHPAVITAYAEGPGGKGANQAVAAARLGAEVRLLGAVGDDDAGRRMVRHLERTGIDCTSVRVVPGAPTGRVVGTVAGGSKRTAAHAGANLGIGPRDVERFEAAILGSDVVLCQLEPTPDVVAVVLDVARAAGIPALLDIAPFQGPVRDLIGRARWVACNRAEASAAARLAVDDEATARDAATILRALGPDIAGVTVGGCGQLVAWSGDEQWTPVRDEVPIVDTAGAGDAFAATLGVLLAEGMAPRDAAAWASRASTLACRALGAQNGIATREELEAWS